MEYMAPLIQTVLWVGLIGGILLKFHAPIYGILSALQKRIESGSNVEAGPFKLFDQLKPQDVSGQKEKVASELRQTLNQAEEKDAATLKTPRLRTISPFQDRYFQAEDLVLRAIQAEYRSPVTRHVTGGSDRGFDGVLSVNGRITIIEVKYVSHFLSVLPFQKALDYISKAVISYRWHDPQIILAVVFERSDEISGGKLKLEEIVKDIPITVIIKCYSIVDLREKFGVSTKAHR